jgi:predicted NBD/HSP70 family sugar kinase
MCRDIGQIRALPNSTVPCRYGQLECLEALSGAAQLLIRRSRPGDDGRSSFMSAIVSSRSPATLSEIGDALAHGDTVVRGLVVAAAQLVADASARIVNLSTTRA